MSSYNKDTATAYTKIRIKRKTNSQINNYKPDEGEPILNLDTHEVRYGDGINTWNGLKSRVQEADTLSTPHSINGLNFDGSADVADYFICSSASNVAAKTITTSTTSNLELVTGATMKIKFSNGNTAADPTLNINNVGAKPIKYNGINVPSSLLNNSNYIFELVYDGASFILTGNYYYVNTDNSNGLVNTNGQLSVPLSIALETDTTSGEKYLRLKKSNSIVMSQVAISDMFKDSFLSSVTYDPATNKLTFIWNTNSGKENVVIDLSDLVDAIPDYNAGIGLTQDIHHTFHVNIAHRKVGDRDYPVSIDSSDNLQVDVPWYDVAVNSGTNSEITITPTTTGYTKDFNISHATHSSVSTDNTMGVYTNSTTKDIVATTGTGTCITIPYINTNGYGHVTSGGTRTYKITLDDGELT